MRPADPNVNMFLLRPFCLPLFVFGAVIACIPANCWRHLCEGGFLSPKVIRPQFSLCISSLLQILLPIKEMTGSDCLHCKVCASMVFYTSLVGSIEIVDLEILILTVGLSLSLVDHVQEVPQS